MDIAVSVELKWLMEVVVEKGLKEDGYCSLAEIALSSPVRETTI
jgi:hypothetical protein